jgi:hypothetical protein
LRKIVLDELLYLSLLTSSFSGWCQDRFTYHRDWRPTKLF